MKCNFITDSSDAPKKQLHTPKKQLKKVVKYNFITDSSDTPKKQLHTPKKTVKKSSEV